MFDSLCQVDPEGRCAAVIMYRHQLAVLPAMKDTDVFPTTAATSVPSPVNTVASTTIVGNSYVDNLGFFREVRDAVFLQGTSEPTLLCLHEGPDGRGSASSTSITALSINIESKKHTKVWDTVGLPSDAYKVVAAPDGGVLVFTGTAVLYIKQQTKAGVVLHSESHAEAIPPLEFDPTNEPMSETMRKFASSYGTVLPAASSERPPTYCDEANAEWNIDCSCASAAWLEDTIALVSFRHGELVTLKLVSERGGSMRLVASKVASGPQPTCMARVDDRVVFIGSRGGDSLLLSWRHQDAAGAGRGDATGNAEMVKTEGVDVEDVEDIDMVGKRGKDSSRGNDSRPAKKTKVADDEVYEEYLEADLLSIFGESDGTVSAPSEIEIQVMDSLISLGAMRKLIAAPTGANQDQSGARTFVGCCGTGSNGALAILQRGIAPDIITTIPLRDLSGMWVVSDSYLLLGFCDSKKGSHHTKVLSAAADLRELTDDVEFLRDSETVSAGTLVNDSGTLEYQVHREGICVLSSGKRVQDLIIEGGVAKAASCSTHVAIMTVDGVGDLYGMVDQTLKLVHRLPRSVHGKRAKVCAMDVYEDTNGWLSNCLNGADLVDSPSSPGGTFVWACYDNGELVICGVPRGNSDISPSGTPRNSKPNKSKKSEKNISDSKGGPGDGAGELTELHPLWSSNGLASGVDVVARESDEVISSDARHVSEIKVECFDNTSHPMLLALNDAGSVFCYSLFDSRVREGNGMVVTPKAPPAPPSSYLRLKRVRVPMPEIGKAPSTGAPNVRLHAFHHIGEDLSYTGFFVADEVPTWIIVNRGSVYVHESAYGLLGVSGFAPFNNENCPHGFLAATKDGMVIANFAPRMKLDAQWPRRKLGIKSVPIDCAYYPEAKLLALIVAAPGPRRDFLPEDGESEAQAAYSYALAGREVLNDGRMDSHEVRLVSPRTWKVVWTHQLLPGERSLCVTAVHLKDQTSDATIPLLAVGTSFAASEDYPCSGRVILIEVSKRDDVGWGGNLLFQREFKGPITNISSVEGYLLLSTGNRLETCILKSGAQDKWTLQRSAFHEGPSLITSLNVVKNFILVGDAQHSVEFLRYKDQGKQIMPLAKDFGQACVRACQFVIAGSSLHIAMADGEGNVRAFTYSPNDPKSWKGQKLDNWGALHVGKGISHMARVSMRYAADQAAAVSTGPPAPSSKTSGAICVTDLGGMHIIMPLTQDEAADQILAANEALGKALASGVANTAGLNPLAFRRRYQKSLLPLHGAEFYDPPPALFCQGLVDGDLLQSFLLQSAGFQDRLSQQLGVDAEKLAATCRAIRDIYIE